MRANILKAGIALLFILSISAALPGGNDPLMGTWKLNLSKSTYSPGPGPRSSVNTYGP